MHIKLEEVTANPAIAEGCIIQNLQEFGAKIVPVFSSLPILSTSAILRLVCVPPLLH